MQKGMDCVKSAGGFRLELGAGLVVSGWWWVKVQKMFNSSGGEKHTST